jgi:hypothetical protein
MAAALPHVGHQTQLLSGAGLTAFSQTTIYLITAYSQPSTFINHSRVMSSWSRSFPAEMICAQSPDLPERRFWKGVRKNNYSLPYFPLLTRKSQLDLFLKE